MPPEPGACLLGCHHLCKSLRRYEVGKAVKTDKSLPTSGFAFLMRLISLSATSKRTDDLLQAQPSGNGDDGDGDGDGDIDLFLNPANSLSRHRASHPHRHETILQVSPAVKDRCVREEAGEINHLFRV